MQLPEAIHLRCFRHFQANLATKLTKLSIPPPVIKQFFNDAFGYRCVG